MTRRTPTTPKPAKSSKRWQQRQYHSLPPTIKQPLTSTPRSYEILSTSDTREVYDAYGLDGLNGRGASGGPDPADIFAELFGGGPGGFSFGFDFAGHGHGPGRHRTRGDDSVIPYDVTLEELYNGKSVKMNMEKEAVCGTCKG